MTELRTTNSLSPEMAKRIHPICERFESAWAEQNPRPIEEFQDEASEADWPVLFRELLILELQYRIRAGESPRADGYHNRFPEFTGVIDEAIQQLDGQPVPVSPNLETQASVLNRRADGDATPPISPAESVREPIHSVPQHFGGYELLEEVARGGMGVVYKARQIKLDRIVALKMILGGQLASEEVVARFYTEAESAGKLDHPNIVPVYDVGEQAGQHYISMGFVEGRSLKDQLSDGPPPPRVAARLMRTIASAVQYAHDQGIVHRDLKPANVVLASSERQPAADGSTVNESADSKDTGISNPPPEGWVPRITDFGLAKRIDAEDSPTLSGQVMGTPSYMPPEQAKGDLQNIGPLSDVYSLGAVLYHLLTGHPPFQAPSVADTLDLVINEPPVPPRQLTPTVPRDLETICLKCLEKESARRYHSAGEVGEELRRWLNHEPIHARPVSSAERLVRWCRRRPVVSGLIAAVLVIAVVAFVAVTWQWRKASDAQLAEANARQSAEAALTREKDAHQTAANARQSAEAALTREKDAHQAAKKARERAKSLLVKEQEARSAADRQTLLARRHAYAANMTLAYRAFGRGDRDLAWRILVAQRPLPGAVDIRGFEWYCLWKMFGHARTTLRGHTNTPVSVSYSPDGKLLASGGYDNTIRIWDVASGRVKHVLRGHKVPYIISIAFSPDGKRLVSTAARRHFDQREIKIWAVETGREEVDISSLDGRQRKGAKPYCLSVAFTPKGNAILAAESSARRIRMFDLSTMKVVRDFKAAHWVDRVAISADGKTLAGGGHFDGTITLWEVSSGKLLGTIAAHSHWISALALSPKGRYVASSSNSDTRTVLWDVSTRKRVKTLVDNGYVSDLKFSRDGRTLAGASVRFVYLWDVASREEIAKLRGHEDTVWAVDFSPDGKRLATGSRDKTVRIWDVPERAAPIPGHTSAVNSVAWAPDEKMLASVGDAGKVVLWDPDGRKMIAEIKGHKGAVYSAAFSPDGNTLATGGADNVIRLWDIKRRIETKVIRAHSGAIRQLAFTGRDAQLLSASEDGTVKLWDALEGQLIREYAGLETVRNLAVGPKSKLLAIGDVDGTVMIIDRQSGKVRFQFLAHSRSVQSLSFSRDASLLVTAGEDRRLRVWKTDDASESGKAIQNNGRSFIRAVISDNGSDLLTIDRVGGIATWSLETRRQTPGKPRPLFLANSASIAPKGQRIAFACRDRTVRITTVDGSAEPVIFGHRDDRWAVAFALDGKSVAVGAFRRIQRVDVETGKITTLAEALPDSVVDLDVSADGTVASVYGTGYRDVHLWEAKTGKRIGTLTKTFWSKSPKQSKLPGWGFHSVRFSPDGRTLYAGSGKTDAPRPASWITAWDPKTRQQRREITLITDYVRALAVSRDGTLVAGDFRQSEQSFFRKVQVWNAETGKDLLATPWIHGVIYSVAFSPDGKLLATARSDGKVRIWNIKDGVLSAVLSVANGGARCVTFSPNGRLIATGGVDNNVKLWDVQTRQQVAVFVDFPAMVNDVAFSPDGRVLAAVSGDGTGRGELRIWRTATEKDVAAYPWRGFLGITYKSKGTKVEVTAVTPNSPAQSVGLKVGDVISSCDGTPMQSTEQFTEFMQTKRAGDTLKFTVIRSGKTLQFDVVLKERR